MSAVAVWTPVDAYRVAVAELPLSSRLAETPADAVAIVPGRGSWWDHAAGAFAAGATAVVVARPHDAPVERLSALIDAGRPVVLERPLLRPDVVPQVLPEPAATSALTVECHATPLLPALRDAIGWSRIVAGAELDVRTASFWPTSAPARGVALLESAIGVPVTLLAATQAGAPPDGRVRITALGDTVLEIDAGDRLFTVTETDAAARRIAPTRFERPERLALRRAIEAVTTGTTPSDLAELRHDEGIARALRAASVS